MTQDDKKKPATAPAAATSGPQGVLIAGVVIVLLALGFIIFFIATGKGTQLPAPANNMAAAPAFGEPTAPPAPAGPPPVMPNRGELLPSGLRIETIRAGTGRAVTRADVPLVRYELRVYGRDTVVDGNFNEPAPTPMPLDGVVPGFAEALTHMRAGGEARFWVPPSLGYGSEPRPGAPFGPNDILEFRVRIEGFAPPRPASDAAADAAAEAALREMLAGASNGNAGR